jgi:hypothetical protein
MNKFKHIKYKGIELDKNKMYLNITDVYHYALTETWSFIQAECEFLNIKFHSNISYPAKYLYREDILTQWKQLLKLSL